MNWSSSIAMLVCVFLMTVLRALVRRGLIVTPVSKPVPDQHEMDWLALRMVFDTEELEVSEQPETCKFWPEDGYQFKPKEDSRSNESPGRNLSQECWSWTIPTGIQNLAYAGTWGPSVPTRNEAQKALGVRRRLGQLTNWVGVASKPSIAVASSIDTVMNTLFKGSKWNVFMWYMKVLSGGKEQNVYFEVRKDKNGKWKTDATAIEAALSLWIFHIHDTKTKDKLSATKNEADSDWLRRDVELKQEIIRLLGPDTSTKELRRDISWWIGDDIVRGGEDDETIRDTDVEDHSGKSDKKASKGSVDLVGFLGLGSHEETSGKPRQSPIVPTTPVVLTIPLQICP